MKRSISIIGNILFVFSLLLGVFALIETLFQQKKIELSFFNMVDNRLLLVIAMIFALVSLIFSIVQEKITKNMKDEV